jgi:hypothetical protein
MKMQLKKVVKMFIPPIVFETKKRFGLLRKSDVFNKDGFIARLRGYELNLVELPNNEIEAKLFINELNELNELERTSVDFPITQIQPYFTDKLDSAGIASGPYFHQDLLVAQYIHDRNPKRHVDVGSRFDGLIAHIASFREIEVFDIRPQRNQIQNVVFKQIDFMDSSVIPKYYCDSVSSLHAIEHFGLGRYGDKIDANGHIKAMENIADMLTAHGVFYLSVPIGPQRIEFNAHRVFDFSYLLRIVGQWFELHRLSFVDDEGRLHREITTKDKALLGCKMGCAILELVRK